MEPFMARGNLRLVCRWNLPRRYTSCRGAGAGRSGVVRAGPWYWWVIPTPYHRVGCGVPEPHVGSESISIEVDVAVIAAGARPMIKHFARRTWRLAVTVGPLVAIALTLAAGMRWHP